MPALAELAGVTKHYRAVVALDSFNLRIEQGELLALLGPNGAGKSTAIGLMLGLQLVHVLVLAGVTVACTAAALYRITRVG